MSRLQTFPPTLIVEPPELVDRLLPGNRLQLKTLAAGLRALVPAWSEVRPGDLLEVFWDEREVHRRWIEHPHRQSFPIELSVTLAPWVSHGEHHLWYSVTPAGRTVAIPSPQLKVSVVPEKTRHCAPLLPEQVERDGLSGAHLARHGDRLPVSVPCPRDVQAGQWLLPTWARNVALAPVQVSQSDLASGTLHFSVPGDLIRATGDGLRELQYHLTDNRGGDESISASTMVKVRLEAQEDDRLLAPPVFTRRNREGWLLIEHLVNDAFVRIPVSPELREGDSVRLDWQAYASPDANAGSAIAGTDFSEERTVCEWELRHGVAFKVPFQRCIQPIQAISPTRQGAGQARYSVRRGGVELRSSSTTVKIELGHWLR